MGKKQQDKKQDDVQKPEARVSIDETEYKKKRLRPEEKELALWLLRENNVRYDQGIPKWQAAIMVGMLIMLLITMAGTIYNSVTYKKTAESNLETSKELRISTQAIEDSAEKREQTEIRIAQIYESIANKMGDYNFTRTLG